MEPVAYAKGDVVRVVTTVAEKVQAEFEGFGPAADVVDGLSRKELQAQAKALGIPANQSSEKLAMAIGDFTPAADENASTDTPDA